MNRIPTRQTDNEVLDMIKQRASGMTSAKIAAARGYTPERVRTATSRVMLADIAESGECKREVAAAYWDTNGREKK